ncbi:hypothetical protein HS088_TW09G00300 [Tripterygium wilfordii]|uniref:Uncharacterized protein n=1 Tax=Tripterygium wilfordii TaxID=458696 RepID=A0A7J7D871_TRIWF|nr:hypothetical protein HS088_TW09G00300 [Tripterygium wilfordii]
MGLVGSLEWASSYSKKQCRSLFWRMRAAVKKAMKNGERQKVQFHYDPSSYALNFDDGSCCRNGTNPVIHPNSKGCDTNIWVYAIRVGSK